MKGEAIYWAAFLVYSALVVFIGYYIYFKDRRKGLAQENRTYWSANQNLSGWSLGLSISASMMSISWSCVYGVQLFYWYGVGGAWLLIIPWLITMAGFFVLAPLFRKMQVFSQPELLEKRFGTRTRRLLAPTLIFVFTTWAGAEIYAAGTTIAPFLGISVPLTIFLIAFIVALYSYTGGFEAVVSTDKIQFLLVALFISIIAYLGLKAVHLSESGIASLFHTPPPPKQVAPSLWISPGMALILLTFFAYLPGWLVETDVWIRLQAGRNNREARKGVAIASLNSLIFVGILPLVIGLAALHLFPPVNGVIPERIQDGALIFTALMQDYSPTWLNAILGIGLIAAAMSTVDTCGNVVALSLSYDLIEPHLKHRRTPEQLNRIARWSSVLAIFLAFVYALFTNSLWDIFYLSSGILTTTVFLPVVASFHPATTARQVNAAILAGFLGTILFYFLEKYGVLTGVEPRWMAQTGLGYIFWGFLLSAVGFISGKSRTHEPG